MKIKDLLLQFPENLAEARILLKHILKISNEEILFKDIEITEDIAKEFNKLVSRRRAHEPISHIICAREFYSINFVVSNDTLDPRPDSETLIDAALSLYQSTIKNPGRRTSVSERKCTLKSCAPQVTMFDEPGASFVKGLFKKEDNINILDLGTGTGCLLLTILTYLPNATGTGIDISDAALRVANLNKNNLNLNGRANFYLSNWTEDVEEKFDLVISNPPYIKRSDIKLLQPEIVLYEPHLALDGGLDGLDPYRIISKNIHKNLNPNARILVEFGQNQHDDVSKIFCSNNFKLIGYYKDLGNIIRCALYSQIKMAS